MTKSCFILFHTQRPQLKSYVIEITVSYFYLSFNRLYKVKMLVMIDDYLTFNLEMQTHETNFMTI